MLLSIKCIEVEFEVTGDYCVSDKFLSKQVYLCDIPFTRNMILLSLRHYSVLDSLRFHRD